MENGYWREPFGEPEWITVPSGEFWMGEGEEADRVFLDEYSIARVPVTNAQYRLFVEKTGHGAPPHWEDGRPPRGLESHPVVDVTWFDAIAYCRWLSRVTGKRITLPSEAEWQKAARGDKDQRVHPWDGAFTANRCNSHEFGLHETTPVGAFPEGASPYGCLDMSGNVWEWTRSLYGNYPYPHDEAQRHKREDTDAPEREARVLRGGLFYPFEGLVRCGCRLRYFPGLRHVGIGFRVAAVSEVLKAIEKHWREPFGEPEWIAVPSGEFWMGEGKEAHRVSLDEYFIARVPVTNAQYRLFVDNTRYGVPRHWKDGRPPGGRESHPVVHVTWFDAIAYCRWLSKVTGKHITLPSEAEWEKAARGDKDKRPYPWGDTFDAKRCNSREPALHKTTPVGMFPEGASPYGCLDMSGNVWEWTRSLYGEYPYPEDRKGRQPAQAGENIEASKTELRVLRGGSFFDVEDVMRCALRYSYDPGFSSDFIGFRVAASPFSSGLWGPDWG